MLFLPIILSVLAYLVINMNGKIGIQGDAGSFFMGSFIAILYTKSTEWNELVLVFFILGPIIFDVCGTTIIKIFYKINLTIGHKDNLYQKCCPKGFNNTKFNLPLCTFLSLKMKGFKSPNLCRW